jgi:hypothetical protein
MRLWKPCLATILLALTVAACGKAVPPAAQIPLQVDPLVVEPVCSEHGPSIPGDPNSPPPATSPMPTDFVTAAVVRCRIEERDVPGQGKWLFLVNERADSPAAELVAQLRRPSDAPTADACDAMLVVPPEFFLVDAAGKAITPAIPTDTCGKPRREALAELEKLPYKPVSAKQRNQVQTPLSITSGCTDDLKDMFAIAGKDARRATGPVLGAPVTALLVCVYDQVTRDSEPLGKLSATRSIEGDAAAGVLAALDKAGPGSDCSTPHTRFAVLTGSQHTGGFAMVELDGCHRLLRNDNTLGQLDGATVAMLVSK